MKDVQPTIKNLILTKPSRSKVRNSRIYAYIIDLYIIVALNMVIAKTWMSFVNTYITNTSSLSTASSMFSNITNLSLTFTYTGYFFFFYYLNEGQTLGKLFFKLKVCAVDDNKRSLTVSEAFTRSIGYLFCNMLFGIPFLTIFLRKDSKSIADYISLTHVLREDEIAYMQTQESSDAPRTAQLFLFPEDSVATRISKAS